MKIEDAIVFQVGDEIVVKGGTVTLDKEEWRRAFPCGPIFNFKKKNPPMPVIWFPSSEDGGISGQPMRISRCTIIGAEIGIKIPSKDLKKK